MQFGLHQIVTPTTERILSIFRSVLLRAWSCKQTKGHGAEQCQDEAVGLSLPNLCNLRLLKLTKPQSNLQQAVISRLFFPKQFTVGVLTASSLVFLLPAALSPMLSPIWSGMLRPPSRLVSHLVSAGRGCCVVLCACLQNFMCDLCNCFGSTVA